MHTDRNEKMEKGTTYNEANYKPSMEIQTNQKKQYREKFSKDGLHVKRYHLVNIKHIFGRGKNDKEMGSH